MDDIFNWTGVAWVMPRRVVEMGVGRLFGVIYILLQSVK